MKARPATRTFFSPAILLVVASFIFVAADTSNSGVIDSAHFSPEQATDQQLFHASVSGAITSTCYSLESYSFSWQGDTLFGHIHTKHEGELCLFVYAPVSLRDSGVIKPPGTYYLRVTEHLTAISSWAPPESYETTFSDTIVVVPCGTCYAGDVDHNGQVAISDITHLVGYMFTGTHTLPCPDEADSNGDGQHDVSDLTGLVRYMFKDGPAPVCP